MFRYVLAAIGGLCLSLAAQMSPTVPAVQAQSAPSASPTPDAATRQAIDSLISALTAASSEQDRTSLLGQHKDLPSSFLASELVRHGRDLGFAGDFSKGLDLVSLGQHLAEQIGDQTTLGTAYRTMGSIYYMKGDHQQALAYNQKSLEIAEQLGNQKMIASCFNNMGMDQTALGNYPSAMDYYQRSLAIAESLHEDELAAHSLVNIGAILEDQAQYAEAESYFEKALATQEKIGTDSSGLATVLADLGVLAHEQNNYSNAMEYYQKSLAIAEKAGSPAIEGIVLTNMGAVLTLQGNFPEAMAYHRRSLAFNEGMGAKNQVATALLEMGNLEVRQNNLSAALEDFQKGLAIAQELGVKAREGDLLNHIGEIHRLQGNYPAALEAHLKALALGEEMQLPMLIAQTCGGISNDYYEQDQFEKAIEYADRASTISRNIGDRETLYTVRTSAGRAYRALGQMDRARQAFSEAMDTVESMRADLAGGEQERQDFLRTKITAYQEMVEMLVAQNQGEQALAFAERAKGRVLLDVLQSGKTQVTKALTEAERDREQQLESTLVALNAKVQQQKSGSKPDQAKLADLKNRLDQARVEYSQFQIGLYAAHPELKTQRGEFQPFTLEQAAKLLPDGNTAFLEYVVTDQNTYLFVLTRGNRAHPEAILKTYTLAIKSSDIDKQAEEFRQKLAQRDLGFQLSAKKLYNLLLKPAQEQLSGKTALVIVPDGALWNLPFQALHDGKEYLPEKRAIAYAPSLMVLREMMLRQQKNHDGDTGAKHFSLLAMADPVLTKDRLAHATLVYRGEQLNPLPEARHEVEALGRLYGGEVYTGSEAREDRFKAEAGQFRVLHLATHGIFDDASPMYSNVLLAAGNDGREDGLLEAREIMQLNLKADLVVLSACETARGRVSAGEGEIGLTWAFFVAGTPSMVVSQWKVESTSTTKLMLAFHRALEHTVSLNTDSAHVFSKARALQKAEVQLMHNPKYSHPFYWASFVVVGDPN